MKKKHSSEPWYPMKGQNAVTSSEGKLVVPIENEYDKYRICDCVNACIGMKSPLKSIRTYKRKELVLNQIVKLLTVPKTEMTDAILKEWLESAKILSKTDAIDLI